MNTPTVADAGCEYVVDAFGCAPSRLASLDHLVTLIERLIADLDLRVVHAPLWHVFDGSGGVTGLILLAESHIAVHTFPERGFAAFNLYHCRSAPEWPWDRRLTDSLAAEQVVVRTLMRGQGVGSHEASAG